ncbi:MAG: UPF0280 family protein [Candidatus Omnitrophica bacterium]|nr:UPF0280 family protein [Candidatus Omnitrophota bacterium]
MHTKRFYRDWIKDELASWTVREGESDLLIIGDGDLGKAASASLRRYRRDIEAYIDRNPLFESSLKPLNIREAEYKKLPAIIRAMTDASLTAGVGPMAGVAGAVSEFVGGDLVPLSATVIIENGGDIFIKSAVDRRLGIYAGDSPLSGRVGLLIKAGDTPCGVSTSSGTVGHSLSFGAADAVTVVARSATLSDAAATAIGNRVLREEDIADALNFSKTIEGVLGCVVIYKNKIGSIGNIELI